MSRTVTEMRLYVRFDERLRQGILFSLAEYSLEPDVTSFYKSIFLYQVYIKKKRYFMIQHRMSLCLSLLKYKFLLIIKNVYKTCLVLIRIRKK